MSIGVLHVTGTKKPPYRTKVNIRSLWLAGMGFVYDAPVWAVPQDNGFTLALRGEHGVNEVGKLIHVGREGVKLALTLNFAKNFAVAGLNAGDYLAARFEYGIIQARKLPDAQNYYVVGSRDYDAFLQMCGGWLDDAGFVPDTITTVAVADGSITLRAWQDTTASYGDIVKLARERKCQIIQPKRNQYVTVVDISSYILGGAGFKTGDIAGIRYEYGSMTVFKPDLQKLGF